MDVIVTVTENTTRRYRVNDVTDSREATQRVQAINRPKPEIPPGIEALDEGQNDNSTYQTQAAPARPATPAKTA